MRTITKLRIMICSACALIIVMMTFGRCGDKEKRFTCSVYPLEGAWVAHNNFLFPPYYEFFYYETKKEAEDACNKFILEFKNERK